MHQRLRAPEARVDERGFRVLEEINATRPQSRRMGLARFKELLREQFLIMKLDEERAITAIPRLLPDDPRERNIARTAILRVIGARGDLPEQSKPRLGRIEALFSAPAEARGVADKQPLPLEG